MTYWQPIATAPFNRKVEVAVLDPDGSHRFSYRARLTHGGWLSDDIGFIEVDPTHWRELAPHNDP